MTKVRKAIVLFATIAMVCTLPLAAQYVQDTPGIGSSGGFTSNTKKATASIFSNTVDNYMDVHGWSGINLDKWFGFVGVAGVTSNAPLQTGTASGIGKGSLGYARKFGDIYLGAWYYGNIVQVTGTSQFETSSVTATYPQMDSQVMGSKTTTTTWNPSYRNATNQIEFLVGIAGQGIKVGYFHSATTDRRPQIGPLTVLENFLAGTTTYTNASDEYSDAAGHYVPYLGWGSVFKVSDLAIKPYLTFALDIYSDKYTSALSSYSTLQGNYVGDSTTTIVGSSSGYLKPTLLVGANLDLPQKGPFVMTAGLEYGLGIWAYNNKYDDSGFSGETKGTASWTGSSNVSRSFVSTETIDATTITINDITRSNHVITPSFKISGTIEDNIRLGAKLWLPVTIGVTSTDSYNDGYSVTKNVMVNPALSQANTTTTRNIHGSRILQENTQFELEARIGVGASYALVPGRFTVNAGFTARPTIFRRNVVKTSPNGDTVDTTTIVDGDGVVTSDTITVTQNTTADTVAYTDTWVPFGGNISAGFALSLGSHVTMDFQAGVPFGSYAATDAQENFSFDLTKLNVLFSFQF